MEPVVFQGLSRERTVSLRSQKSCRQVKARTSSPRPQFRVTSLYQSPPPPPPPRFWLAENVSIRKLASGRTGAGHPPCVYVARLCTAGVAMGPAVVEIRCKKVRQTRKSRKLRRELSLTIPGSIIASLNAVITSLACAALPRSIGRDGDLPVTVFNKKR